MTQYEFVWQYPEWPSNLCWDAGSLLGHVSKAAATLARAAATVESMGLDLEGAALVEETVQTSAIESETLDRDSVRSSVARRLGLNTAGLPARSPRAVDGLVELLADATRGYEQELSRDRLFGWHAALFPTGRAGTQKISVGSWRQGDDPMQVVSGALTNNVTVHFEAPPSAEIPVQMERYLEWWSSSAHELDGLLRAGVAHLYFLTVHPFDDGNGRIARALTDMALAQHDKTPKRFFSMSKAIEKRRAEYYRKLEENQRGDGDITSWLLWFMETLQAAVQDSMVVISEARAKSAFWSSIEDVELNVRQRKVVAKLVEAGPGGFVGGMTNKKYVAIAKTSPATAKRDLAGLVEAGVLKRGAGQGRGAFYELKWRP